MAKKVKLKLVGLNGNAFVVMGAFQSQARREGWSQKEIEKVLQDAKSGDYEHLLSVIANHCENPLGRFDEDEEDDGVEDDD